MEDGAEGRVSCWSNTQSLKFLFQNLKVQFGSASPSAEQETQNHLEVNISPLQRLGLENVTPRPRGFSKDYKNSYWIHFNHLQSTKSVEKLDTFQLLPP